ncbi:MAG: nitroreductase family protein [Clostridia bacterium]|nr:nitroreductase family protein [Clostridia bacterium]
MDVIETLKSRRSIRAFTDQPLTDEQVKTIAEVGTYAASGMGKQPAKILAITNKELIAQLSKINAGVMGMNLDPFHNAPAVFVVLSDKSLPTYLYDGTLVMANMMHAANALGLGSCWVHRAKETYESAEGKEILKKYGIEGNYEGIGNLIVGYPAEEKEAAPRKADFVTYIK